MEKSTFSHILRNDGVVGSNPISGTNKVYKLLLILQFPFHSRTAQGNKSGILDVRPAV